VDLSISSNVLEMAGDPWQRLRLRGIWIAAIPRRLTFSTWNLLRRRGFEDVHDAPWSAPASISAADCHISTDAGEGVEVADLHAIN